MVKCAKCGETVVVTYFVDGKEICPECKAGPIKDYTNIKIKKKKSYAPANDFEFYQMLKIFRK